MPSDSPVASQPEATVAEVSAATRAVPGDLAQLLEQHGVDPGHDSRVRTRPGFGLRLGRLAVDVVLPLAAAAAVLWMDPQRPGLWAAAAVSACSASLALNLLRRKDPGMPLIDLAGALAICAGAVAIPWLVAGGGFGRLDACAAVILAGVAAVTLILPVPRNWSRSAVRAVLAGTPVLTVVLLGVASVR